MSSPVIRPRGLRTRPVGLGPYGFTSPRSFRQLDQLLQHQISGPNRQVIDVRGRQMRRRDRRQHLRHPVSNTHHLQQDTEQKPPSLTLDRNPPTPKHPPLHTEHIAIIRRHQRHDRHAGLDGEMKGALLEGQQVRLIEISPRALGKNEDALTIPAHFLRRAVKGRHGRRPIRTIDEDGAGQGHEPAEKGDALQRLLGRDAAVGREDGGEQEDVELGLVVGDEDGRAGGEVVVAFDLEVDAGRQAHEPFEAAACGPLRDAAVAEEPEDDGGEDAVGGAEEEREVGGEAAGVEGGAGELEGEGEEGSRDADVEG